MRGIAGRSPERDVSKAAAAPRRLRSMYRITVHFDAATGEAEELQDRLAELLRDHALTSSRHDAGYVVALAEVPQPEDDDAFLELVAADAARVVVGPPELLDDLDERT